MAAISTVVAVAGLGISAVGQFKQQKAAKKAARAQEESLRLQQRSASIRAARERVQQVREARIKRAQAVAGAAIGGTLDSSGLAGGVGGIQSQLGANLAFSQNIEDLGIQATAQNVKASNAQSQSNMWGAVAGFGQSMFSNSSQIGSMFGPQTKPKATS